MLHSYNQSVSTYGQEIILHIRGMGKPSETFKEHFCGSVKPLIRSVKQQRGWVISVSCFGVNEAKGAREGQQWDEQKQERFMTFSPLHLSGWFS